MRLIFLSETTQPAGFARRELYVDARDLQSDGGGENPLTPEQYLEALSSRGAQKLAERRLVRSFTADIRTQDPTYLLDQDFFLGDTVTVIDLRLGATAQAAVQGVEQAVGPQGESLTLSLGFGQPTLYDKLKRKAER